MYALAAAAACFEVITVEPVPLNVHKLLTSARVNNMSRRLHVINGVLSDVFGLYEMGFSHNNQGAVVHSTLSAESQLGHANIVAAPLQAMVGTTIIRSRPVFIKIE